ncbi:hypothetical protein AO373_1672 [Moraxella catarrhalis]|nr:hypothetical protein AO373_1672 [Moraxella catarrhalis]
MLDNIKGLLALIYPSIALSDVLICKHRLEKYTRESTDQCHQSS